MLGDNISGNEAADTLNLPGVRPGGGHPLRDIGGDLPDAQVLHLEGQGVRHHLQDRHNHQG